MVKKLSIRQRLLVGTIACAFLTALAGGAGIYSLNLIHGSVQSSTTDITASLADQISQNSRLARLRSLAIETLHCRRQEELNALQARFQILKRQGPSENLPGELRILKATRSLLESRQDTFSAEDDLIAQSRSMNRILGEISSQALTIADNVKFEAVMAIERAWSAYSRGLEHKDIVPGLDGIRKELSQLSALSEKALSTVMPAMSVRAQSSQLQQLAGEILNADDVALVTYKKNDILNLISNMALELDKLSGLGESDRIARLVSSLPEKVQQLSQAKSDLLRAETGLDESVDGFFREMNRWDDRLLGKSRELKAATRSSLLAGEGLVNTWMHIEILLAVSAFLLAALIGSILSHTVSRQLRRLNQGVRSVGEGDLSCTVDTGTRDEIGDLSRSFDSMTQKLALREQDLKEQEQRFRRLFENSNDGIIIHTLEQTILDVNRRMLELTGLSRETLLSRSMAELIHQPSEDGCTEALVSGLHQHGGQLEVRMLQADGGTIEVDIRTTLIDPDEGIIQSVVRDITERKQAEQQLKHQMLEISQANYRLEVLVSNTAERERRMVQLKQEVNELLRSKGLPKKYQAPDEVERQLGTGLTQPPPREGPASGNDRSGCTSSMES